MHGGAGQDELEGAEGRDLLTGGYDPDILEGHEGEDRLFGDEGADQLDGGSEDDLLVGGAGVDVLWGVTGDDRLEGGSEDDELYGEEGDDQLSGSEGADLLYGDKGKDVLIGGSGKDQILGGTESDWLFGDRFNLNASESTFDQYKDFVLSVMLPEVETYLTTEYATDAETLDLYFQNEDVQEEIRKYTGKEDINDLIKASEPIDKRLNYIVDMRSLLEVAFRSAITSNDEGAEYDGDSTTDWSGITPAQWELLRQLADDPPNVYGDEDRLQGEQGDDWLLGGHGPDLLEGGVGSDVLLGGTGNDILKGYAATMNLVEQFLDGNDALEGGEGNDELWGAIGDDLLAGGDGNDKLVGDDSDDPMLLTMASPGQTYAGRDVLAGGYGSDTAFGALGEDILYAGEGGDYADKLTAGVSTNLKDLVGDVAMPYAATTTLSTRERIEEIKEYVFKLINLPTDIRSLGFDRLVGGINSDVLVGHRLRPVNAEDLKSDLNTLLTQVDAINAETNDAGDNEVDLLKQAAETDTVLTDLMVTWDAITTGGDLREALESVVLTLDSQATDGDDAGIHSGKHFTLNRRSTDGVVYELAPGTGTDIVWNFYAGEHDGTTRNVVRQATTESVDGRVVHIRLGSNRGDHQK